MTTQNWLITHRTQPAWQAALLLLQDDQPHPIAELVQTMRINSDLAERTVVNHLARAGKRGWISRRHGQVRIRNRQALERALGPKDTRP